MRLVVTSCAVLLLLGACATSADVDTATTATSTDSAAAPRNDDVTARARTALTAAGVTGLEVLPGYEREPNTAIEGTWRHRRVTAYVVPTAADVRGGELSVVGTRTVLGRRVELVRALHGSATSARFSLDRDTWLVRLPGPGEPTDRSGRVVALTRALLDQG